MTDINFRSSNFESVGDDSEFRIMDNEQNPVVSNYQNGSETHSHHQNLAASRSCQSINLEKNFHFRYSCRQ